MTAREGRANAAAIASNGREIKTATPKVLQKRIATDGERNFLRTALPLADDDFFDSGQDDKRREQKNVHVLFLGCDGDLWKVMRRHLPHYGFTCTRTSNMAETLEVLHGDDRPSVIVLGAELEEGMTQIEILGQLKKINSGIIVIYISEQENSNSALIIASGADDIVTRSSAKPKALSQKIEIVLMLHQAVEIHESKPVICEINDGKSEEIDGKRIERIKETMARFSSKFDMHQRGTRHYAVMNAILTSYPEHLGRQIIDIGCGTGYPMRQLIRNVMVPDFDVKPPLRENSSVLCIDNTLQMLLQAQDGYERLKKRHNDIDRHLKVEFMHADILEVTLEILEEKGFQNVDTVFASYFAHWVVDKEAAVKKIAELISTGGKFITVEEWPLVVTPGPHMDAEMVDMITSNVIPIGRKRYYSLIRDNGFKDVEDGVVVFRIDKHHKMYGNVFEKV